MGQSVHTLGHGEQNWEWRREGGRERGGGGKRGGGKRGGGRREQIQNVNFTQCHNTVYSM